MNRLLTNICMRNIQSARSSNCFHRFKCNDVKSEKLREKLSNSDNIKRDIKKRFVGKIWNAKDQKTKENIIKSFVKINSRYDWNNSTVYCLLRSKTANNAVKINEDMKMNSCAISCALSSKADIRKDIECGKSSKNDNAIRPIRREPGEVVWGFIPKEWATFFVPITGHSGFYTLMVTFGTYLLSKEIYVCDHEYYNGISLVILCIYVVKKTGPTLAKYLDKEIDNYERNLNIWKEKKIQHLKDSISSEKQNQECMEGQIMLIQAKREDVHLQREAEFRRRQMEVYENVTRILNYHVEREKIKKLIQHKNLIQWVTKEVEKSLTPELKEKYMSLCMEDIKKLLKKKEK